MPPSPRSSPKPKRNWFANVHSKLNAAQWGRSPVGTTKTRHLHEKESGGHKERASLIEPMLMLSISMGRVNFAKGNWLFLSCLPWGYKQIHELGLKLLLLALLLLLLLKWTVAESPEAAQKGKTEMPFALTTLFHAPFEHGPLHGRGSWEACWHYIWGKLTRKKQKQCAVDSEHTLVSFPHWQKTGRKGPTDHFMGNYFRENMAERSRAWLSSDLFQVSRRSFSLLVILIILTHQSIFCSLILTSKTANVDSVKVKGGSTKLWQR